MATGEKLRAAKLREAKLRAAELREAELRKAELRKAELRETARLVMRDLAETESQLRASQLGASQLRAARAMLEMEQAELAKLSGVSVETIKRLEHQTGKLRAKIETIVAIEKAFEAKKLEFIGGQDGRGAGVRLMHPDELQPLREAVIGEWTKMMDQWLKDEMPKLMAVPHHSGHSATDLQFLERCTQRLARGLAQHSTSILPTIIRRAMHEHVRYLTPKDGSALHVGDNIR
jgi:transcriptional regulator with XRE-family HTH domain